MSKDPTIKTYSELLHENAELKIEVEALQKVAAKLAQELAAAEAELERP